MKNKQELLAEFREKFGHIFDLDHPIASKNKLYDLSVNSWLKSAFNQLTEDKEKSLGFWKQDIEARFTPNCSCGEVATKRTAKGEYAQENNHRPVNWGYYCDKCYQEGVELENEAMYGFSHS